MNFIIALIAASSIYWFGYSISSQKEKILKEKGMEGITPKYIVDAYRKKGMSDEQIVDGMIKTYQNTKKWAPVGAVIGFILVLILLNFFNYFSRLLRQAPVAKCVI